jgi:archaellum component FlaC
LAATLDDIYGVLKDCCAKLGTNAPGAPGTGVGGAPGTGTGGAGADGLAQELGGVDAAAGSVNQLEDAVKQAQSAVGNAKKGTEEYNDSLRELRKAQAELNKEVESGTKGLGSFSKALGKAGKAGRAFGSLLKVAGGLILDYVKATLDLTSSLRAAEQSFRATTGASKAMADNIGQAYDQLRIYGVSISEAAASTDALYGSVSDFSTMSGKQQQDLVKTGALLAEVGVSTTSYASGIQHAMKTMSMSGKEARQMFIEMRATAIDLQMPIGDLTGAFSGMEEELAKMGKTGSKTFKELARISKITGVEMNKIVSIVEKFDTFEGAAEAAGSLNAMLGGNFVNSMDLMMAEDPAERFMMLRDALDASGQSFENMGRFQKIAMANAMDVDVSTLGKMMSGNMEDFQKEMGKTPASLAAVQKDAFTMKSFEEIAENIKKAFMPSINALENAATNLFDKNADSLLAATQAINSTMIAKTEEVTDKWGYFIGLAMLLMQVVTAIGSVGGWGLVTSALSAIGTALSAIGGAIFSIPTAIALAVVAAVGGFMGVYKKWQWVLDGFKVDPFEALTRFAAAWYGGQIAIFGKIVAYIAEFFGFNAPWITTFKDSFSPKNFDQITQSMNDFFQGIGKGIVDFFKGPFLKDMFAAGWDAALALGQAFRDVFDISSPSLWAAVEIGKPLIDGLLAPFKNFGPMIRGLIDDAYNLLPAWAQRLITVGQSVAGTSLTALITGEGMEDTMKMASGLATESIAAAKGAVEAQWKGIMGANDTSANKDPYVLNLSMNMDGREMDKKVVNVVGGIAQAATYGD